MSAAPTCSRCSASRSSRTAVIWRRSKSVIWMARQRSLALGHGGEHEPEDGVLAERMGVHLEAPALLEEQALEQIRGPDGAAVVDRHPEVG